MVQGEVALSYNVLIDNSRSSFGLDLCNFQRKLHKMIKSRNSYREIKIIEWKYYEAIAWLNTTAPVNQQPKSTANSRNWLLLSVEVGFSERQTVQRSWSCSADGMLLAGIGGGLRSRHLQLSPPAVVCKLGRKFSGLRQGVFAGLRSYSQKSLEPRCGAAGLARWTSVSTEFTLVAILEDSGRLLCYSQRR